MIVEKWVRRFLGIMDDDGGRADASKLEGFALILLLHLACRDWILLIHMGNADFLFPALAFSAFCTAAFSSRYRRRALLAAAVLAGAKNYWIFPHGANHLVLEFLCIAIVAAADLSSPDQRRLALSTLKWIPVLVLFWAGGQKLLYGTYFHGTYLAYLVADSPRFQWAFDLLLSNEAFSAMKAVEPPGPYRFDSLAVIWISNSVWISEILIAVMLLVKRWRWLGILASCVLFFGFNAVAREVMFMMLFFNLMLLYAPSDWNRRMLPVFFALYSLLIGIQIGLFWGGDFN